MHYHVPVLKDEVLTYLAPAEGQKIIDATLGDGGHTLALLKKEAEVLGLDYNQESLKRAEKRIKEQSLEKNFTPKLGNFRNIDNLATKEGFEKVHGILFDLGFSSTQLEQDETGLSFQENQPLDMRLDKTLGVTSSDLLHALSEDELARLFKEYSDERHAKRFASAIVKHRELEKLQTTEQLAKLISAAAPPGYEKGRIHPATRVFQALRIAVNDEIENLKLALPRAAHLLLPGGRMVVISFHSLEDKAVKDFGRTVQPDLIELTDRPVTPSDIELKKNVRSRSAKMRVFEKQEAAEKEGSATSANN
ncbi:16S rRNA (cytosine(1402)-N(4))-methyltransferase RsmH [candidate division WWE3 bacterium]|nr:16S rRNA (cytosine(1402)-N(4))-methyltransferase RsmH [candidate division WWE3 bacterium]